MHRRGGDGGEFGGPNTSPTRRVGAGSSVGRRRSWWRLALFTALVGLAYVGLVHYASGWVGWGDTGAQLQPALLELEQSLKRLESQAKSLESQLDSRKETIESMKKQMEEKGKWGRRGDNHMTTFTSGSL